MKYYVVIGAGFSATSVIKVLVNKNIKPLVLNYDSYNQFEKQEDKFENIFFKGYKDYDLKNPKSISLKSIYKFGGLSNTWGGFINKIHGQEIKNWPITFNQLDRYYKYIDNFFFQIGNNDEYSKEFRLKKIKNTYSNLQKKKYNDFFVGKSRIVLNKNNDIFSVNSYLNDLKKKNKIDILNNFKVKKITENSKSICIYSSNNKKIFCKKLYIASGSIETSKIILNSFKNISKIILKEVTLEGSLWFSLKKLNFFDKKWGCDTYMTRINKTSFHIQTYFFCKSFLNKFFKKKNLFYEFIKLFMNKFGKYFFFTFTYFDQNLSREIEIIKDNNKFVVYDKKNLSKYDYTPYLKRVISSKIFRIFSLKRKFGFGNHYGSSFPMSLRKKKNFSDIYGRINNLKNVHIVDSSILSSIPISTITYTVMANAARIADLTSKSKKIKKIK